MKCNLHQLFFQKYKCSKIIFLFTLLSVICSAQTKYYVTQNGSGNLNGSSWSNASKDLQATINNAASGSEIWVARGTYKPVRPADNLNTTDLSNRKNAFVLNKDVKLYGGFSGWETNLYQRNWNFNKTILNGNIGIQGDDSDNCYHVVIVTNNLNNTILDGFIISDGNANNPSSSMIVNSSTINNGSGGGLYFVNSSLHNNHLIIKNNMASDFGGGVYSDGSSPTFINSLLFSNIASDGGAIYSINSSYINLINSTIASNTAYNKGGGMNVELLEGYNCIIAQNEADQGNDLNLETGMSYSLANCLIGDPNGITETISGYNLIINQDPAFEYPPGGNYKLMNHSPAINFGENSLYNESVYGLFDLEGYERIQGGAIDIGAYERKPPLSTVDFRSEGATICKGSSTDILLEIYSEGFPPFQVLYDRIEDGVHIGTDIWYLDNMGTIIVQVNPTKTTTYELNTIFDGMGNKNQAWGSLTIQVLPVLSPSNGRLYVDNNIITSGSGSSWDDAVKELADAILYANTCGKGLVSEIWVAQGTYFPMYKAAEIGIFNYPTNDKDKAFVIPKNVKIYGGFLGNENSLEQRNWKVNETILNGDINQDGDLIENCYHLVIGAGDLGDATLDGFIIKGAFSNGTHQIEVNNQNVNQNIGGGIYNVGSTANYNNLMVMECAGNFSGGIYTQNSSSVFNKIIIQDNMGSGVYSLSDHSKFVNCLINNNSAPFQGGGMLIDGSSNTILNSTIVDNTSSLGSGLSIINGSTPQIQNCIIWGNDIDSNGSTPVYSYSIQKNVDLSSYEGCLDGTNPANHPTFDTDYKPTDGVINKGKSELYNINLFGSTDLSGNLRITGPIDLGAYEIPCSSNPMASFMTTDTISCGGSISLNIHIEDAVFPCRMEYTDDGGSTINEITSIYESDFVFDVSPSITTTYRLISITDANSCSNAISSNVHVLVDPLVVTSITGDTAVCVGNTIQLESATPNGIWNSDHPSIAIIDADGSLTGVSRGSATITYTVINSKGCTNFASKNIEVEDCANFPFTAKFTTREIAVCTSETASLNVNIIGGTAPYIMKYEENGIAKTIQNITSNSYILKVSPKSTSVYKLTGINDNSGLQNDSLTSSSTVRISAPPSVGHLSTPPPVCPGEYLDVSKPVVLLYRKMKLAEGWLLGGEPFNPSTDRLSLNDHGKSLVYWIENSCGRTVSNSVTISVKRGSIVVQDIGFGCDSIVNLNLAIVSLTYKASVWFFKNPNDTSSIEDPSRVKVSTKDTTTFYVKPAFGASICDNGYFVSFKVFPSKATQKITFPLIENKSLDSPDFNPEAISTSGLAIQYSSSDPEVAIIQNNMVHITGSGEAIITASQPGNECFLPAEIATQLLVVEGETGPLLKSVEIDGNEWYDLNQPYTICDNLKRIVTINLDVTPGAMVDKGKTIVLDIPEWGLTSVQFTVTLKNQKELYTLYFDKRFEFNDIVKQRWNNTFTVINNPIHNGGYKFIDFKWFKNEQLVGTSPYYSVNNLKWDTIQTKDLYRIQVTTDNGQIINSCYWDGNLNNIHLNAYPNPVQTNETVHVETNCIDIDSGKAFIHLYDSKGAFIRTINIQSGITPVKMPTEAGVYILNLTLDNELVESFKVIVKK